MVLAVLKTACTLPRMGIRRFYSHRTLRHHMWTVKHEALPSYFSVELRHVIQLRSSSVTKDIDHVLLFPSTEVTAAIFIPLLLDDLIVNTGSDLIISLQ